MIEHIIFKCGHIEPKKPGKRYYKPQERLCFACYRKQQLLEAEKRAAELGLPQLRGTPKQVAWALVIRNGFLGWTENVVYILPQAAAEYAQNLAAQALVSQDSAKFWIEEEEKLRQDILDSARQRYNIVVEESNNDDVPF